MVLGDEEVVWYRPLGFTDRGVVLREQTTIYVRSWVNKIRGMNRLCPIVYQLIFASVPPAICLPISRGLFVVVVCLLPFVDSMLVHETSAAVERKTWRLESIRCSTAHRVSSSKSYSAVTINGRTDDQIHDDSIWSGVEDFLSSTSYLSHSQSTDGLKKHFEKGAVDRPLE